MSYPFVAAGAPSYGRRKGPVKAFVVHMAEGGGTVSFLSHVGVARGVSVHYVIEYSGRIVQMLDEADASGSINARDLRTSDEATFGATVRRVVMGEWDRDPNSAVISLEIEGFAGQGPNVDQAHALERLVDDVRSRHPRMGLLGHRDFQDYKACPGKHVRWDELGGHGPAQQEDPDMGEHVTTFRAPIPFSIPANTRSLSAFAPYEELSAINGPVTADATVVIVAPTGPHGSFLRIVTGATGRRLVPAAHATPLAAPPADCTVPIAAAVSAERTRIKQAAIAAVEGVK